MEACFKTYDKDEWAPKTMFDYMEGDEIQNLRDLPDKLDIPEICYPWNI